MRGKKTRILIPEHKSRFLLISCPDCGNEQATFDRASIVVKCNVCGRVLVEPTGSKANIKGKVIRVLE
ncbi:MAG: 30S ribosomal protein S27e [Candidatus Methanomethylicia archaeon]|nr:30S ribosomal protein S27e [Candidatus Methanomethylicia archaeon]